MQTFSTSRRIFVLACCLTLLATVVPALAQDVQDGDLFVGALRTDGADGAIFRVRGSAVDLFCQPPAPKQWFVPGLILTDSLKRVVALAISPSDNGVELVRCSSLGGDPENLAFFQLVNSPPPAGWPVPFPGNIFYNAATGLNYANSISIDATDGSNPQLKTGDTYIFLIPSLTDGQIELMRYHADDGTWDLPEGSQPGTIFTQPPDMITGGLSRYYVQTGMLHRIKEPLKINVSGQVQGVDFQLLLSLFASEAELNGVIVDDTKAQNIDSGCDGSDGFPTDMPFSGAFNVMDGFYNVVYDSLGSGNLVVASNSGAVGSPYLTDIQETLLDNSTAKGAYFHDLYLGCSVVPRLFFTSLMPFSNPDPPYNSNLLTTNTGVKAMASTKNGLVGTQSFANRVVLIQGAKTVTEIASGLGDASGIAAYPPAGGSAGLTILLRVDSSVTSMLTDPNGKHIGIDPVTQQFVNDFNTQGFDSGPGNPRIFGIWRPAPGHFTVQSTGTGNGPYTVHVYSTELSHPQGQHIRQSGLTQPGQTSNQDFQLGSDGTVTFLNTSAVTLSPAHLSFPNQVIGTSSAAKAVTLTNSGTATLTINNIMITGDFAISSNTCGATLAVGKKCKVTVTFTPSLLGKLTGTLTFTDDAPDSPQPVLLTGTGVLPATLTPASATYAKQAVGTTSPPKTFTLTNNQTVALTSIAILATGDFAVSATTCTASLATKGRCTISVTFTPTATGIRTGQLSVSDSANNSPQTSSLKGTGK